MKKYLFVLLGLLVFSATTVYAQELTEKEKERQEKEAKKQAKENAKKEAKLKKAAKKDAKIAQLRTEYEEFLVEWTPIEANIGIAEVDTFFYGGKNEACQYVVGLKKSDCFGFQSVMVE